MNKTTLMMVALLIISTFSLGHAQSSPYDPNQIILHFAEGTSDERKAEIIDSYNGEVIDSYSENDVLVEIQSFSGITDADGRPLNTVVEIITSSDHDAEIIDRDLNYQLAQTPMNLS